VAEAHSLGFVHRDIKPSNLFASERPGAETSIKVFGWALSKTFGVPSTEREPVDSSPPPGYSNATASTDTPFYMSPEQIEATHEVDERTDIWSLGVTLCELVTGRVPFEADTLPEVYSRMVSGQPLCLRDSYPHLPPGLEELVLKCLERDRRRRYRDVAKLAGALLEFAPESDRPLVERISTAPRRGPIGPAV